MLMNYSGAEYSRCGRDKIVKLTLEVVEGRYGHP